jgi:hypothetical protein
MSRFSLDHRAGMCGLPLALFSDGKANEMHGESSKKLNYRWLPVY